jgi:uncharacterized protein YeeX (DUF496 family)
MTKKEITSLKRELKDIDKRLRIQKNLSKYIPDAKTQGKVRKMIAAEEKRVSCVKALIESAQENGGLNGHGKGCACHICIHYLMAKTP